MLSNLLLPTNLLANSDAPEIDKEINRISEIYDGRIIIVNNSLTIVKDTYSLEEGKYLVSPEVIQSFNNVKYNNHDHKNHYLKLTYPITHNTTKDVMGVIVMNFSTKDIQSIKDSLEKGIMVFVASLATLILVSAFYFSNKLTKPLTSIVNFIDQLTEGYLDQEVSIKGYYEIEKISDSFNKMISRMQKLEKSRQEFVSMCLMN